MSTKINSRLRVVGGAPNVDELYGPYNSVQEAFDILGPDDQDVATVGLTVGIITGQGIVEYWFKKGCSSPNDLVVKNIDNTTQLGEIENVVNNNTTTLAQINNTLNQITKDIKVQQTAQATDEWLIL